MLGVIEARFGVRLGDVIAAVETAGTVTAMTAVRACRRVLISRVVPATRIV